MLQCLLQSSLSQNRLFHIAGCYRTACRIIVRLQVPHHCPCRKDGDPARPSHCSPLLCVAIGSSCIARRRTLSHYSTAEQLAAVSAVADMHHPRQRSIPFPPRGLFALRYASLRWINPQTPWQSVDEIIPRQDCWHGASARPLED